MPYRYNGRSKIGVTKRDMFKQIKERRGRDIISLYSTPKFNRLTDFDLSALDYESHIWSRGDNFYKLAHEFYGDPAYWWVVALFNNAPTEQHIKIGEEIFVPREMESVAALLLGAS